MAYGNLSKQEKEIVKMIREKVPKVKRKIHDIPWYKPHLWKYRTEELPVIGIKLAIDIVVMVREELNKGMMESKKEMIFPESREEKFMDEDLKKFYKKKGYKIVAIADIEDKAKKMKK